MFRGLSSWLGLEQLAAGGGKTEGDGQPEGNGQLEGDAPPEQRSEEVVESAEEEPQPTGDQELLHQAKGLGNYLFNFASAATKKISESVAETAQTIKKSVEEGKIDGIIDKTIIGDFQKEQKNLFRSNIQKSQRQQCPHGLTVMMKKQFNNKSWPYQLVKEEVFWRNYFYRVSLIKQSAQLTALAAQQQAVGKEENSNGREDDLPLTEAVRPKTPPVVIKSQLKPQEDEEEVSTSPGVSEFVSDAFEACNLNQEDLRKEMEQLVLDKKEEEMTVLEGDSADWEEELQQELQEYEVVTESEKRDENWDKEIEKMLEEEN